MTQLTVQEREALMADMRSFDEPEVIDIYHGSPKVIEQPVFGEGKVHNDYGRGFYCTEHAELAKEWACSSDNDGYANRRTKQEQRPSSLGLCLARRRKTIVNHYQLETKGLTVLNLNTPEYNILNWLAILLENRKFNVAEGLPQRARAYILENFKVDYKKYDIIIGYRANRRSKQEQRPSSLGLCLARRRKTIVNDSYFSYAGDFVNGTLSLSDLSEAMRLGKLGELVVLKSKKAFDSLTFVEAIKASRQEYFAKYKQRDEEARGKYRQIASKPLAESEIYVIDIIRNNWKNGQGI